MSPTFTASLFERAKRRVREDVGSRTVSCVAVREAMGEGQADLVEGGGG